MIFLIFISSRINFCLNQMFISNNNEEQAFLATDLSTNPEMYASGHACWDDHDNHEFTSEMNSISR